MANLGTVSARVQFDRRQIGRDLSSAVDGASSDTDRAFGGIGRKAALAFGAAFAAFRAADLFGSAIQQAGDLSESLNKVNVVFGQNSEAVVAFSKTAAVSLGQSQQQALEAAGTFGNLFVALGLTGKEATNMSTSLVTLASDLASFNNVSPEDALLALRSGLVGETEPLRRFGVNLNDATIRQKALKLGLISTVKDALTPAVKAQASYALILEQTKTAQGDFARTSGGLANQQRILAAQWTDLKARIGAGLLPVVLQFVTFLNTSLIPGIIATGGAIAHDLGPAMAAATSIASQLVNVFARRDFTGGFFSEDSPVIDAAFRIRDALADLGRAAGDVFDSLTAGWQLVLHGFEQGDVTSNGVAGFLEALGKTARTVYDYLTVTFPTGVRTALANAGVTDFASALDVTKTKIGENQVALGLLAGAATSTGVAVAGIKVAPTAAAGVKAVASPLTGVLQAFGGLAALAAAHPFVAIATGVAALIAGLVVAYKTVKPFHDSVDSVARSAREVLAPAAKFVADNWKILAVVLVAPFIPIPAAIAAVGVVMAKLGGYARDAYKAIVEGLRPLSHWLDENVLSTLTAVGEFMSALADRIADVLRFLSPLVDAAAAVFRTLAAAAADSAALLVKIAKQFAAVFVPIFKIAFDLVRGIVETAFGAIRLVIETVLGIIRGIFQVATGVLRGDFSKIWEGLETIVSAPFNAVKDFISRTLDDIVEFFRQLPDRLAAAAGGLFDFLWRAAGDAVGTVVVVFADLIDFFTGLPGQIVRALGSIARQLFDWGAGLVKAVLAGIASALSTTNDKVNDALAMAAILGGAAGGAQAGSSSGPAPVPRAQGGLIPQGAFVINESPFTRPEAVFSMADTAKFVVNRQTIEGLNVLKDMGRSGGSSVPLIGGDVHFHGTGTEPDPEAFIRELSWLQYTGEL